MDYKLKRLYENMLREENPQPSQPSQATLSDVYKTTKASKAPTSEVSYEQVIYKYIGDVQPLDSYDIGKSTRIQNSEDLKHYKTLFSVTPPKVGKALEDAGSKGSGNGEIALYWLLKKTYPSIKDNRDSGKPDLAVNINGTEIGLEVKAYDSKKIGLGRFGDQKENRNLLSIVFGIKALLSGLMSKEFKRPPSLDTFNKDELLNSFEIFAALDKNGELRNISTNFAPIREIYRQIDLVKTALQLESDYTTVQGAANMLLLFLLTKLQVKPGFEGYMVNVKMGGEIDYHKIPSEQEIRSIDPNIILNNVNANGAALLINLDALFK